MEIRVTKGDVIWNYLGTFFNVFYGILLMPFVYKLLTIDELGLWYVFSSVSQFTTLFDMGFSVTMSRHIAYCISGANNICQKGVKVINEDASINPVLLKQIILVSKFIYTLMALIIFIILQSLGLLYINKISMNFYIHHKELIWRLFATSIGLNIYLNYYLSIIRGSGKIKEINKAYILSKVIVLITNVIFLFLGYGLLSVSISQIISTLFLFILLVYYSRPVLKIVKNNKKDINFIQEILECRNVISKIWYGAYREGLVTLSTYINNQFGTLLISTTGNMKETAAYGICVQFINIVNNIAAAYNIAIRPKIQSLFIKNKIEDIKKYIGISLVVYYSLFICGIIGILVIGSFIIQVLNKNLVIDNFMCIVISVYIFLGKNHSLCAQYISDSNNLPYVKPYIISSGIGIFLVVLLLKYTGLGIYSYILSIMFVQLCYNNWKWPMYLAKQLETSFISLIKNGFIYLKEDILYLFCK